MKKVLGIFCHPDDEILFGWPVFQSSEYEKNLIICCDDYARRGSVRLACLQRVCKQENIHLVDVLQEDNDFYALPTRRATNLLTHATDRIVKTLNRNILNLNPDYIFTHNPVGEYGHGSHRLLFELVSQSGMVQNLLMTDLCEKSNHRSSKEIPKFIKDIFYTKIFRKNCNLDIDFYNRCKVIYDKYNAWTWSQEPIKNCNLYILKDGN